MRRYSDLSHRIHEIRSEVDRIIRFRHHGALERDPGWDDNATKEALRGLKWQVESAINSEEI